MPNRWISGFFKPFLKGCLIHYNKECEFRYNDKKNLHQVLLEWMRKNLLMLIQIYSNRRLYHAGFVL